MRRLPRIHFLTALCLLSLAACDGMHSKDPGKAGAERIAAARIKQVNLACASNRTYDRLKNLAFDEAIKIRNADPLNLETLATYSVIRMENPLVTSRDDTLDVTVCRGRFVLHLPPGAERGFNGETSIQADVEYTAQAAADGSGLVYQLSGADPIIYRLAAFDLRGHKFTPPPKPQPKFAEAEIAVPADLTPELVPSAPNPTAVAVATPAAPPVVQVLPASLPAPAAKAPVPAAPVSAAAKRPVAAASPAPANRTPEPRKPVAMAAASPAHSRTKAAAEPMSARPTKGAERSTRAASARSTVAKPGKPTAASASDRTAAAPRPAALKAGKPAIAAVRPAPSPAKVAKAAAPPQPSKQPVQAARAAPKPAPVAAQPAPRKTLQLLAARPAAAALKQPAAPARPTLSARIPELAALLRLEPKVRKAAPASVSPGPAAPRAAAPAAAPPKPPAAKLTEGTNKAVALRTARTAAPAPPAPPRTASAPARPVRSPNPSFDCRYARSRGEGMVCGNARLASLERSVSRLYNAALGEVDGEGRYELQRTRQRFHAYLDRCRTESCVANAYQGRMEEIREIISSQ